MIGFTGRLLRYRIRSNFNMRKHMLLKALRTGTGLIIVGIDRLTRPKPVSRTEEAQSKAQSAMEGLSLYQLNACPFCIKTRRALHKLNVKLDIRDIGRNKQFRHELENGGGRVKVPCLLIEKNNQTQWMYESDDIIQYLQEQVA